MSTYILGQKWTRIKNGQESKIDKFQLILDKKNLFIINFNNLIRGARHVIQKRTS